MNEEAPRFTRNLLTSHAVAATLALTAMSGAAEAHTTGGAHYDSTPAPQAQTVSNGACPAAEKVTSKNLSTGCRTAVMKLLRDSVYDDPSDMLAVATYQKLAKLPVDGALGPITTRSVLKGKALKVASPDPKTKQRELYIRKSDQVAYVLGKGKVEHVLSISSGSDIPYSEKGQSGKAHTPTGNYRIKYIKDKNYTAPLGAMPHARFYNDRNNSLSGFAVHAGNVDTNGNDSHGCIRVDGAAMVRYIVPKFRVGTRIKIVK
ncbi:MAG: L,D-transpeptidase [Candidatus Saccharimonadales bacterium]